MESLRDILTNTKPILHHLLELRRRALHCFAVFVCFFITFFFLAPNLFHQLIQPLLDILPKGNHVVATHITSTVFVPLQLAMDASILCTAPFMLYNLWHFIAPGLYRIERVNVGWAIISSLSLFILGLMFCYVWVLPFMLQFFISAIPTDVHLMPDMISTVDFMTRMLLIFGMCFQVPLICLFLVRIQLITIQTLKEIRPYVIVGAFVIAMLLTPPDVLSQITLAVPLCLLYELGIVLARLLAGEDRGGLTILR
jgi:sec-independent protein translocase protein TatC